MWEALRAWTDTLLIAAILGVDLFLLLDQRRNQRYFRDFFESRTRWYEARGKGGKGRKPAPSAEQSSLEGKLSPSLGGTESSLGAASVMLTTTNSGVPGTPEESTPSIENVLRSEDELSMSTMEIDALAVVRPDLSSSQLTILTDSMEAIDGPKQEPESESTPPTAFIGG